MTALVTFVVYLLLVFLLAGIANRTGKDKKFINEYFLGSRNIGMWAFALTYAATAASGGTFVGFPSLIYTHGWVVGWWIAGYMVVPLVSLGLLAKRINQVSRIAGAITVPELLRRRFQSNSVGTLATIIVVFFMFFYLVAQFKAGAVIMTTLLEGVAVYQNSVDAVAWAVHGIPWLGVADPGYLLCLIVFALFVIAYTAFGGFRAVVWTDVMQGLVMLLGVVIMFVLIEEQIGGVNNATLSLAKMTTPEFVSGEISRKGESSEEVRFSRGEWFLTNQGKDVLRLREAVVIPRGETKAINVDSGHLVQFLRLTTPEEIARVKKQIEEDAGKAPGVVSLTGAPTPYAFGAGQKGVYTSAPGPSADNPRGFLTVLLAFSFFVFWNFSGAGQPSYMVRQMAFRDTVTLRRSMIFVAVYFAMIYFPLVLIFASARILLPGMEVDPDRIMPELAAVLTSNAGVPWMAGLLIAAPFAAVMSTVDSFLLLVSSGVVRDIYQQNINPNAGEKRLRRLSHWVTITIGVLAVIIVVNPISHLQDLIVFASAGLGACFLAPIVFSLYWSRMTGPAASAGMVGGSLTLLVLYVTGAVRNGKFGEYYLFDCHPFIWAFAMSAISVLVVSLMSSPPTAELREKYFGKRKCD